MPLLTTEHVSICWAFITLWAKNYLVKCFSLSKPPLANYLRLWLTGWSFLNTACLHCVSENAFVKKKAMNCTYSTNMITSIKCLIFLSTEKELKNKVQLPIIQLLNDTLKDRPSLYRIWSMVVSRKQIKIFKVLLISHEVISKIYCKMLSTMYKQYNLTV